MEAVSAVIGVIVVMLLIWLSIKVVKFVVKMILWLLVFGIIVGALAYYYPFDNLTGKTPRTQQSAPTQKQKAVEKK
jgi:hypothetical protein